jgi:hypothetical protein
MNALTMTMREEQVAREKITAALIGAEEAAQCGAASRLMMMDAHCQQMAELLKTVCAENEELKARLHLAEIIPASSNGGGTHVEWMRVISQVWRQRLTVVGERNLARSEVDRLTKEVNRLETAMRQQEADFQLQIRELIMK